MKVVSLKQSEQQPDAARAALRAAILTKSKADAAVTTASAKLEAARTLFSRTEEKLSAAVAAIDDAKNEDAEATAMGAGAVTTAAIRKQRQKVADLEDEVAVCAGAKTRIRGPARREDQRSGSGGRERHCLPERSDRADGAQIGGPPGCTPARKHHRLDDHLQAGEHPSSALGRLQASKRGPQHASTLGRRPSSQRDCRRKSGGRSHGAAEQRGC